MDLKEIDILGEDINHHWYYSSKAKAISRLLSGTSNQKVLDVGAGSGFFSKFLLENNIAEEAWCIDTSYEEDYDDMASEKVVHYRRSVDISDAEIVLLMDVIEHVDDDVALIKTYADKVPSGSRFLITVPAFNFLWSGHDDFLGHKRRYSLDQLELVAGKAGLKAIRGGYYFGAILPIAIPLRLINKITPNTKPATTQLTQHHPATNALLKLLCYIELPFLKYNRFAGLTVFCLAEKDDQVKLSNNHI